MEFHNNNLNLESSMLLGMQDATHLTEKIKLYE